MNQHPQGEYPRASAEVAVLTDTLTTFFSNDVRGTASSEELTTMKLYAANAIADALLDPEINDTVAEILIDSHTEEISDTAWLIACYSLIQRARDRHPDKKLPEGLLSFLHDIAQEQEESDLVFDMMIELSEIDISYSSKAVESTKVLEGFARDTVRTLLIEAAELSIEASKVLSSRTEQLDLVTGEQYEFEKALIVGKVGDPDELILEIQGRSFRTSKGLYAALSQYDNDLLAIYGDNHDDLLEGISEKRFLTPSGIAAAKSKQDRDRIMYKKNDSAGLRYDITKNRFLTNEGSAAAKALHDKIMLTEHQSDPTALSDDLTNNRFHTAEGIAEAQWLFNLSQL